MTGALNAWDGLRWAPVDLKGPVGDPGPVGPAGAFTWPASNYQNFTNTRSVGDGVSEPGPLTAVNAGSTPCCRVYAGNTSRIEFLRSGIAYVTCIFQSANVMQNPGCYVNIRKQPSDTVLCSGVMVQGETDQVCAAIFPVVTGDILSFPFNKISTVVNNVATVIRAGVMV